MTTDRSSWSPRCTALRLHDVGPHLKGRNLTATKTFSPFSFLPVGFLEDLRGTIGMDADTAPSLAEPCAPAELSPPVLALLKPPAREARLKRMDAML